METSVKITSQDLVKHRSVAAEAVALYVARSGERGQMWKDFAVDDSVLHINSKAARIKAAMEMGRFAEDDALDLINYCIFYIRKNRNGE